MRKIEHPSTGGSYIRDKNGKLKRVEGTKQPEPRQKPEVAKPPVNEEGAK